MPLKRLGATFPVDEMLISRMLESCRKLCPEQTAPFSSDKISSSVRDAFRQSNTNRMVSVNRLSSNS